MVIVTYLEMAKKFYKFKASNKNNFPSQFCLGSMFTNLTF